MPRLTRTQPAYRLHKASAQAVVKFDNREYYLGPHGSPESRAEYDRLVALWLANGRRTSTSGAPSDLTINELIVRYWAVKEAQYRRHDGARGSELDKIRLAFGPLRTLFGSTPARDFDADALEAVQRAMISGGLCCRTVNQRVTRIRSLFRYAKKKKLVPPDVYHALADVGAVTADRFGARASKVVRPVSPEHVDAVYPFLSPQLRAVVGLQRLTGMRSGEALGIRTGDIDRAGRVWRYTPKQHKGLWRGKSRTIYFGPKGQAVLAPWLRADPGEFLFQPSEAEEGRQAERTRNRKTPLTPSQRARTRKTDPKRKPGAYYTSRGYHHAVTQGCDRAGVPRWHPHQLRHSAGTNLRGEFGPDTAQAVLGHTDITTTTLYAQLDEAKAIAAMERVG